MELLFWEWGVAHANASSDPNVIFVLDRESRDLNEEVQIWPME